VGDDTDDDGVRERDPKGGRLGMEEDLSEDTRDGVGGLLDGGGSCDVEDDGGRVTGAGEGEGAGEGAGEGDGEGEGDGLRDWEGVGAIEYGLLAVWEGEIVDML
jgi:hypothetical protein